MPVVFDLASGEVRAAGNCYPLEAVLPQGAVQVGRAVVEPLTFGQRTQLVRFATGSTHPREAVRASITDAAVRSPGSLDQWALSVISLSLAGAETAAPGFADTVLIVGRVSGWTPDQINQALATEVDALALHLGGEMVGGTNDWTRLVFATNSLTDLCQDMVDLLLSRAGPGPVQQAMSPITEDRRQFWPAPEPQPRREPAQFSFDESEMAQNFLDPATDEATERRPGKETSTHQETPVNEGDWSGPPPEPGGAVHHGSGPSSAQDAITSSPTQEQPSSLARPGNKGFSDNSPVPFPQAAEFADLPLAASARERPGAMGDRAISSPGVRPERPTATPAQIGSLVEPLVQNHLTRGWLPEDPRLPDGLTESLPPWDAGTPLFVPEESEANSFPSPSLDLHTMAYELGLMLEDEADLAGLDP